MTYPSIAPNKQRGPRATGTKPRRYRPSIEALEGRALLSSVPDAIELSFAQRANGTAAIEYDPGKSILDEAGHRNYFHVDVRVDDIRGRESNNVELIKVNLYWATGPNESDIIDERKYQETAHKTVQINHESTKPGDIVSIYFDQINGTQHAPPSQATYLVAVIDPDDYLVKEEKNRADNVAAVAISADPMALPVAPEQTPTIVPNPTTAAPVLPETPPVVEEPPTVTPPATPPPANAVPVPVPATTVPTTPVSNPTLALVPTPPPSDAVAVAPVSTEPVPMPVPIPTTNPEPTAGDESEEVSPSITLADVRHALFEAATSGVSEVPHEFVVVAPYVALGGTLALGLTPVGVVLQQLAITTIGGSIAFTELQDLGVPKGVANAIVQAAEFTGAVKPVWGGLKAVLNDTDAFAFGEFVRDVFVSQVNNLAGNVAPIRNIPDLAGTFNPAILDGSTNSGLIPGGTSDGDVVTDTPRPESTGPSLQDIQNRLDGIVIPTPRPFTFPRTKVRQGQDGLEVFGFGRP